MRFTVLTAIAAMTCVQAIPHLDERGTYEVGGVISVGADYSTPYTEAAPEYSPQAQYDTPPMPYSAPPAPVSEASTPVETAAAPARTQYVVVGGTAGLVYTPEYIFAEVGEVIKFHFSTKNHTLTQSTFPEPCNAMPGGMDSGFKPFTGAGDLPSFEMTVSVTTPQWFYCQQKGHCKMGMVFAINPPTSGDKTFQAYKNLATGGTATVVQTVNTATTVSVTAAPPPPPPPPAAVMPGYNVATDGQCQCVCNIDINNGAANPAIQGLGVFGGEVGNVQAPWMMNAAAPAPPPAASAAAPPPPPSYASAPPPPAYASAAPPPPAYTAAAMGTPDTSTVGGFSTLDQGSVIALGAPPAATPTAAPAPPAGTLAVDPSPAPAGGFTADGALGGAAGK